MYISFLICVTCIFVFLYLEYKPSSRNPVIIIIIIIIIISNYMLIWPLKARSNISRDRQQLPDGDLKGMFSKMKASL